MARGQQPCKIMNFKVRFWAETKGAVDLSRQQTGLKEVELIRTVTDQNVSLDKISDTIDSLQDDPLIEISEETARNSTHFDHKNVLDVRVPAGGLNAMCRLWVTFEKDEATGEITHAKCKHWIDEVAVIWWWADKGYPKNLSD